MANPELVIFDFDGTLINSEPGIHQAIQMTVEAIGLPITAVEQWRQMIGIPLEVQLSHLLPPERHPEINASVALYRQFYDQVGPQYSDPFPGIDGILEGLRSRLPLAIASSKRRETILRVLEQWRWQTWFNPVISPAEVIRPKPHPESLHRVLDQHDLQPHQALMIGDSVYDMEMARRAGVMAWGVTWGIHGEERLRAAGAEQIFSTPQQLWTHLQPIPSG